jgi:phosphomevalonate kinase
MLAGEYAVLHRRPSLVMAVDRYATARALTMDEPSVPTSPEVREVLALAHALNRTEAPFPLEVDVTSLHGSVTRKLGLGSSAAACVAALGLAWLRAGRDLAADRMEIALIARRAHRKAQGGGSGADVLASALGGVVSVVFPSGLDRDAEVAPHPGFGAVPWAVFWSGTPARTSVMIERIEALRARDRVGFESLLDAIAEATRALDTALRAGDSAGAVYAVRAHHVAMNQLGKLAGTPVVTEAMERLAQRAEPLGAAVKPSGAGGGDVVIAVAQSAEALTRLCTEAAAEGFTRVPLAMDGRGVDRVVE